MSNDRNAGRKRKLDITTIQDILMKRSEGRSVSSLAEEYGVSRQTMSYYINDVAATLEVDSNSSIDIMIRSLSYWKKLNNIFELTDDALELYNIRLDYMWGNVVNTCILASYKHEHVLVKNNTSHPMKCAFGVKKNPTWDDYMHFLEERCVPKSRDHMKVVLNDYDLDFYDPISIIKKTGGRMAGDDYHIRIYSLEDEACKNIG